MNNVWQLKLARRLSARFVAQLKALTNSRFLATCLLITVALSATLRSENAIAAQVRVPFGAHIDRDERGTHCKDFPTAGFSYVKSADSPTIETSSDGDRTDVYLFWYDLVGFAGGESLIHSCYELVIVVKPKAFRDFHFLRSDQFRATAQALDAINCTLAVFGCALGSLSPVIEIGLIALDVFRTLLGDFSSATSLSLTIGSAFSTYMADTSYKAATDPPDANFTEFFEYSESPAPADWGFSEETNKYLDKFFAALRKAFESLEGQVVSMERMQGALLADEMGWAYAQQRELFAFAIQSEGLMNEAADLLDGLPTVLENEGESDVVFDPAALDANLDRLASEGMPQDIVTKLVAFTGDSEIEQKLLQGAETLRGVSGSSTAFELMHSLADTLRITIDNSADTDVDGVLDGTDNCPLNPNVDQADDDFDAVGNPCDYCAVSASGVQVDVLGCATSIADHDGDGIEDADDNCPTEPNTAQENSDGDAQGDACDSDDDNDGVTDNVDQCPNTVLGATVDKFGCSAAQRDTDSDGVRDNADNCPTVANANQLNFDDDGSGDACDPDVDNDGVLNVPDQCDNTPVADRSKVDATGCVPAARICDVDVDRDIDARDIMLILKAFGKKATGSNDPRDSNFNRRIDLRDAAICASRCDRRHCATR